MQFIINSVRWFFRAGNKHVPSHKNKPIFLYVTLLLSRRKTLILLKIGNKRNTMALRLESMRHPAPVFFFFRAAHGRFRRLDTLLRAREKCLFLLSTVDSSFNLYQCIFFYSCFRRLCVDKKDLGYIRE